MTLNKAMFILSDDYKPTQTGGIFGSIKPPPAPFNETTVSYTNPFTVKQQGQTTKQNNQAIAPEYRYEVFVFVSKAPEVSLSLWDSTALSSIEFCVSKAEYLKKAYDTEVDNGTFFSYVIRAYKTHIHLGVMELLVCYEKVGKVKEKVYLNGPKKAKSKTALTNHLNKLQGAYTNAKN